MSNLYTTTTRSTLLVNKLREIISEIQTTSSPLGNLTYQTYDEVAAKTYNLLSQFYRNINEPIFKPIFATERIDPEKDAFNKNFSSISADFAVLFREFENLEDVLLGGWNFMVSRNNRLKTRLKQAATRMADLALYSSIKVGNYIFTSDSFNSLERIESNSPLLKEPDQLEINQEEGILVLPVDTTYNQQKITTASVPIINATSNGVVGNNHEYATTVNYDPVKILDYNADTWFEYERVVNPDDGVALQLDLTINLGADQIINFLRINPNNFGSKTELEILQIATSKDGNTYLDIKDDLLAPDIVDPDTGSLKIAPSTAKFAGQGLYSFFPRKARYIRLFFKQSTPYLITSYLGQQKWRYAIGLRDIWIERRKYKEKGELISKAYTFVNDPVRKLVLETEQSPTQDAIEQAGVDAVAEITHSISPDNGVGWYQIRPKESAGQANATQLIPEVLDFNGVDPNTIKTKAPVTSLRYKVHMLRNSDAFSVDTTTIKQKEILLTELHQTPTSTPFNMSLQQIPVANSVKIVDPFLGSRGLKDYRYSMQVGASDETKVLLPFAPILPELSKTWDGSKWNITESNPLVLKVGGVAWSRGKLSAAGSSDRYYQCNLVSGEITFGNNINGKAPNQGTIVEAYLAEERLFPTADQSHECLLKYPVASDVEEVELYLIHPARTRTTILSKGATVHKLVQYLDDTFTLVFSNTTVFQTEQTFVDGSVELESAGDYSVDYENGVVYSYSMTLTTEDTSVTYRYTPREQLDINSFSFIDIASGLSNGISISNWKTFALDAPETIPTGVYYFNLGNLAIVKGSLRFAGTNVTSIFLKEVPFIDGRIELLGVQRTTEKIASITASVPGTSTISLSLQISSATDLEVAFSNTAVFVTEKSDPGLVTTAGDYYIYRTAGNPRVLVYVDASVTDPGYVSYYYADPNADLTGAYSVDYDRGEVFTHTVTIAGLTANYRYSDYRIKYPIARLVNPRDYTVSAKDKQITIKDREIMKRFTIEKAKANQEYYRVTYKYLYNPMSDIAEYEDFYTPVLASYKLKIVPQSKIAF